MFTGRLGVSGQVLGFGIWGVGLKVGNLGLEGLRFGTHDGFRAWGQDSSGGRKWFYQVFGASTIHRILGFRVAFLPPRYSNTLHLLV